MAERKSVTKTKSRSSRKVDMDKRLVSTCTVCGIETRYTQAHLDEMECATADDAARCMGCGALVCADHGIIAGLAGCLGWNPAGHLPGEHAVISARAIEVLHKYIQDADAELARLERLHKPVAKEPLWKHDLDAGAFMDFTADMVRLRLAAGAHPDDAMMDGLRMLEAWTYVQIDGAYPPALKFGLGNESVSNQS